MGAGNERTAGGEGHDGEPVRHHAGEPGVIYAANNRGLFRSDDAGRSWKALELPGQARACRWREALACLPE